MPAGHLTFKPRDAAKAPESPVEGYLRSLWESWTGQYPGIMEGGVPRGPTGIMTRLLRSDPVRGPGPLARVVPSITGAVAAYDPLAPKGPRPKKVNRIPGKVVVPHGASGHDHSTMHSQAPPPRPRPVLPPPVAIAQQRAQARAARKVRVE